MNARHVPLTLSESVAEMQRWREDFVEQQRRQTNPMVVLSALLAAAGAGSRVSVDGRRVLLTQADGQVLAFEARCSDDAEWIADTAALDREVVREAASICAASVYGFAKPVYSAVALRAWPARMVEGLPIGWARGRWGRQSQVTRPNNFRNGNS